LPTIGLVKYTQNKTKFLNGAELGCQAQFSAPIYLYFLVFFSFFQYLSVFFGIQPANTASPKPQKQPKTQRAKNKNVPQGTAKHRVFFSIFQYLSVSFSIFWYSTCKRIKPQTRKAI
jgi:hypothetical protein